MAIRRPGAQAARPVCLRPGVAGPAPAVDPRHRSPAGPAGRRVRRIVRGRRLDGLAERRGRLPRQWDEVIAAGNHLHEALRRLPKPDFVDERQDRWAVADRIAWGEQPAGPGVRTPLLQRLLATDVPDEESQLVHCDLSGNVLFEPGLPPAVIDLSLYWRPTGYATAIVLTDAVSFEGAGAGLVARHDGRYLPRAIAFRLATDRLAGTPSPDADVTYRRVADLALG